MALLLGGLVAASAQAAQDFGGVSGPTSIECNLFGASIGQRGAAWANIIASGGIVETLWKHCNTRYCGREARGHYSMVYEHMPCSRACYRIKKQRYDAACIGNGG
ncbi:hypothetical protein MAIT1_00109 [Magnetofaba australis IT-1]|uniref:Uncharacterized protein n=2 Tax=Magnetofaba TaxID=1472292 RepID=A0A1Y2K8A9_9PROT|nr:hypothetical protein MAIT1_00109 [Magnetofaba australis IT-1]